MESGEGSRIGQEEKLRCNVLPDAMSYTVRLHRALEGEEAVPHSGEKMGPPITDAGSPPKVAWIGKVVFFSWNHLPTGLSAEHHLPGQPQGWE